MIKEELKMELMKMKITEWHKVFIADLAAACFAYSLLMINQLVNQYDGLWHGSISYAGHHEFTIGRWLWPYLDKLRFYLSPDPVTSVISIILFILSFIFLLDIMKIPAGAMRYIASLLFTVSTSVLVSLSYRYMSPTFAAACFFAMLSAYLLVKCSRKWVFFLIVPLLISFMMGLYQADLGCLCFALLLYISLMLYKAERSGKEILSFTLRCFLSVILGGVMYYVLLYLNLWVNDMHLDSYGGADSYGPVGMILHLPERFLVTYSEYARYFRNHSIKSNIFSNRLYLIVFLMILLILAYGAYELFLRNRIYALFYIISLALIPFACNVVLIIAFEADTQIQMTVPMSMSIPGLLCLCTRIRKMPWHIGKLYGVLLAVASCVLLYGNYIITIYDQQAMYMGKNSMEKMASQIVSELQINDLYHPYYQYVFVGKPSDNPLFVKNEYVWDKANRYARFGGWSADDTRENIQSWQGFWTNCMGTGLYVADDEHLKSALEDQAVMGMPIFPEKGSCVLYNDVVVVKLSDIDR